MTVRDRVLTSLFCLLVVGCIFFLNGCAPHPAPLSQPVQHIWFRKAPLPGSTLCYAERCRPLTGYIA